MFYISKYFLEAANVPCEQANGLTVPFGIMNLNKRNNMLLADAQNLSGKSSEEQQNWMNKYLMNKTN